VGFVRSDVTQMTLLGGGAITHPAIILGHTKFRMLGLKRRRLNSKRMIGRVTKSAFLHISSGESRYATGTSGNLSLRRGAPRISFGCI
jgi:hypothetical protein